MGAIARARGWKGQAGDSIAIETIDNGARSWAIGVANALGVLESEAASF